MNLKMNKVLPSGSTIGILGGGQLGQMLSMAAARLGFKTHIFEPSANPPASNVSSRFTQAEYDDYDKLKKFASSVDVVTYEFENIPTGALDIIEKERKDRVDDALNATRAAVQEGIVVGGGVALVQAGKSLEKLKGGNPDQDAGIAIVRRACLLYTSPSPRDGLLSRMPSSA